ncbi:UNVERIFIED_CONTAM: hypothetical protein PYX00_007909 [Menopon gallinae]|uniref:BZIP domain-containing protein n=1 Tax=Menopon gallinae TaxID=328185 RepID=A0AAW2HLI9_9NEOP
MAAVVDEVVQGTVPELYYQPSPESVKKLDPLEGGVDKDRSDDRKRVPRKKQSAVNERKKSYQDLMLRKREQNKRAAMRYRQRKKAKAFEMFMEEKTLVNKNKRLQQKVRDIQTEIRALKVLMRVLSINKTS